MDSKKAELCAAITGDGWIEKRGNALYICGNRTEDKDYYNKWLIPLFSKCFCKVKGRNYDYWQVYGFSIYRKQFIDEIIKLGIKKGKKVYDCEVPLWIFTNKEFMLAFLRGIFDTDGCIYSYKSYGKYHNHFSKNFHHKIKVSIGSSSLNLIRGIEKIGKLLKIGFTKIYVTEAKPTEKKNNGISYRIEINKKSEIDKWFLDFKLSKNPKHLSKYQIWKRYGFCPNKITLEVRRKILKGIINPYSLYAGVTKRSNVIEKP